MQHGKRSILSWLSISVLAPALALVLAPVLSMACGGTQPASGPAATAPPPAAATTPTAAPAPTPPTLRLPRTVLPTANRARLSLDPNLETFSGHIEITATVAEPVDVFWLNATELHIDGATITTGTASSPLEVIPAERDFVGFRAPAAIPAGTATIAIDYRGRIDSLETEGIFRQQSGDDWYLFTQFEATDARRAFPCFDEPDNKVPWQLTLEVPDAMVAASNTPITAERAGDGGTRVVEFATTKPLPSYLVAFAVGPFDVVDAGATRTGVPMRVLVAKGSGPHTGYVVEATGEVLAAMEDYFGMPYPYAKLDTVAIPMTVGFGAMENPGLITYNERLIVARPEDRTIRYERGYVAVAAHEFAHQWFGNYVTMKFWNDIWLNEAFASWMGDKVVRQLRPAWGGDVELVTRRDRALGADKLASARVIRQPIATRDDIENAFDGITYTKGASVIQMFETWVGEDVFRAGVRGYLARHAWSNADADDFLAAIGEAAGTDVRTPFSTFLDQVGAPLITFDLHCDNKGGAAPRVSLRQERYLPLGSEASADQTWQVPVCVTYPTRGKATARACTLLTAPSSEIELADAKACPAWVLPNDGMLGYYRAAYGGDLLDKLLRRGLDTLGFPARVGVIGDVNALVAAGKVDYGLALGLVARMVKTDNRFVIAQAAGIVGGISEMVPDALRPAYAKFVRSTFGARARKLGWTPAAGDDDDTKLLRATLLGIVTDKGEDAALAAEAATLADRWLSDPASIDPDLVDLVLDTAAMYGDAALWQRLYDAARAATDPRERQRLLGTLAQFRQPELVDKSMQLVLTDEFDIRQSFSLLFGALRLPHQRATVYAFVKAHYDELAAKMPERFRSYLVYAGVAQCDPALVADVEAFFGPRLEALPGGPRTYAQAIESMKLCIDARAAQTPGVVAFLSKRK